jgi:hypothetical protein
MAAGNVGSVNQTSVAVNIIPLKPAATMIGNTNEAKLRMVCPPVCEALSGSLPVHRRRQGGPQELAERGRRYAV